jgi:hypothetical protein
LIEATEAITGMPALFFEWWARHCGDEWDANDLEHRSLAHAYRAGHEDGIEYANAARRALDANAEEIRRRRGVVVDDPIESD